MKNLLRIRCKSIQMISPQNITNNDVYSFIIEKSR